MKVTIISIVIGTLSTVTKGTRIWKLEDEWRTSKVLHYWDRPGYWEESWKLEKTCCHSNINERSSVNTDVKNSQQVNNNNNNNRQNSLVGTWAAHLLRYSGPFLKWTREELKQMDQRTRKLMICIKHCIPELTLTDYMCQEEREEEDLPALKKTLTHRYNNLKTT